MSSSLKLNGTLRTQMHGAIPKKYVDGAKSDFERKEYRWTGWARIDGSRDGTKSFKEQWPSEDIRIVIIKDIVQFTETNRHTGDDISFNAEGRQIAALVNKEGQLKILTRAAKGEEKKIHNRMPVTVKSDMGRKGFITFMKEKLNATYE